MSFTFTAVIHYFLIVAFENFISQKAQQHSR